MSTIAASSSSGSYSRSGAASPLMLSVVLGVGVALLGVGPAKADLRLCNQTASKVGISLGYRDPQGWVTEGWWDLAPKACETLLKGALAARFYYVFAVDYTRGGEWSGRSLMCTRDSEFTIRGVEDCLARGYDRNGFFEVDTGEQKSWTIQLTDPNRADAPAKP
ncbi:hypothetical protein AKJ13_05335 [Methylobacterium sp. ARG-1]|nr:hypothetical protein AKJ13_05335 [Methylobacterium sp. ARG-1]